MVELMRLRNSWAGQSGGAGNSTWHIRKTDSSGFTATNVQNALSRNRLLFENTSEWLPNDVTISWPAGQDMIDSSTDSLIGEVTATTGVTSVTGAYTGNWQNGVGTRIIWGTNTVANGRKVRGYTYLVPYGGIFDNDGTLSATATADLVTNAAAFISGLSTDSMTLVVYRRDAHAFTDVTSAAVSDKTVVLRTRRD